MLCCVRPIFSKLGHASSLAFAVDGIRAILDAERMVKSCVKFRFAEPTDAAKIIGIYAPYCEGSHISFEVVAPTVPQMQERMARISVQYPWLVCEIDDELAGYVYASQHRERAAYRWAVDVAVYVSAAHHRRGVGRALYRSLFDILREQNYCVAYAGICLPNPESVGLHEGMGFKLGGVFPANGYKLGGWRDVGWWHYRLTPILSDPPEPLPIGRIRESPAVRAKLLQGERLVRT